MNIDKVNDAITVAWHAEDEATIYELAGDMVDEIRRLHKALEWTDTKEDLPKDDNWQWVMLEGAGYPERGAYHGPKTGWYIWNFTYVDHATYWMPIAELPKEST